MFLWSCIDAAWKRKIAIRRDSRQIDSEAFYAFSLLSAATTVSEAFLQDGRQLSVILVSFRFLSRRHQFGHVQDFVHLFQALVH
jgi:hypothetical protein